MTLIYYFLKVCTCMGLVLCGKYIDTNNLLLYIVVYFVAYSLLDIAYYIKNKNK